jgi:hypothetical protein
VQGGERKGEEVEGDYNYNSSIGKKDERGEITTKLWLRM